MSVYNEIKKALSTTIDVVVDKTTTQAQKSRLVTVMKNEEKIANQAYIELGKYLYRNLRENAPAEVEELCAKLDESKERMSRAQQIYREVIQQEMVNREINKTEVKENFRNIKDPLVSKAKDTAVKVKDTAIDTAEKMKTGAKDTAVKMNDLKEAAVEKAEDIKKKHQNKEQPIVTEEEAFEAEEEIVEHGMPVEESEAVSQVLTVGEGLSENVEVIENAIFSDSSLGEDSVTSVVEEEREIFSFTKPNEEEVSSEAEDMDESFVPEKKAVDQEFQRNVPVDIISEKDFEEDEPEVKPVEKNTPFTKAMKLKNIITKKNSEED